MKIEERELFTEKLNELFRKAIKSTMIHESTMYSMVNYLIKAFFIS